MTLNKDLHFYVFARLIDGTGSVIFSDCPSVEDGTAGGIVNRPHRPIAVPRSISTHITRCLVCVSVYWHTYKQCING